MLEIEAHDIVNMKPATLGSILHDLTKPEALGTAMQRLLVTKDQYDRDVLRWDKLDEAIAQATAPSAKVTSKANEDRNTKAFEWLREHPGSTELAFKSANGLTEGAAKGLLLRWIKNGVVTKSGPRHARTFSAPVITNNIAPNGAAAAPMGGA